MRVCMYVCMYACMCVCICIRVCMYACMHVCMYVCMYACMHACMYACMHVCIYACMDVCIYVCLHACMYVEHAHVARVHSTGEMHRHTNSQDRAAGRVHVRVVACTFEARCACTRTRSRACVARPRVCTFLLPRDERSGLCQSAPLRMDVCNYAHANRMCAPGRRILCLALICSSLKAARLRIPFAFACAHSYLPVG